MLFILEVFQQEACAVPSGHVVHLLHGYTAIIREHTTDEVQSSMNATKFIVLVLANL